MNRSEIKILIVGAGPTGLTAGVELARRGIKAQIISTAEMVAQHSHAL